MATETYTGLAQGQLANATATLYTVLSANKLVEFAFRFYNTGATTETVTINLYDGSTSRVFATIQIPALGYAEIAFDKTVLEATHTVKAHTTTATTVNYWLSGVVVT